MKHQSTNDIRTFLVRDNTIGGMTLMSPKRIALKMAIERFKSIFKINK